MIVVSIGGGFSSTAWLPRILLKKYRKEELYFVTCVLPNEHPDMFKLHDAVESALGIIIHYIAYDKDNKWRFVDKSERQNTDILYSPMKVFLDQKFLGNSRMDVCSRLLKRETMFNFISEHFDKPPVMAVGIHGDEIERIMSIKTNWESKGFETIFSLIDYPNPPKETQIKLMQRWYGVGIELYDLGFEHNNCHGACVKAGQKQWAMLYYYYPNIYSEWEAGELEVLEAIGKSNMGIIRKQVGGKREYWTLKKFREELEKDLHEDRENFLTKTINNLPQSRPCMWCSAI